MGRVCSGHKRSIVGSSPNAKLCTVVALASSDPQQGRDETRLEQLMEGSSLLGPKLNCSHSTRCLGPLSLSSYFSLAEPMCSQNLPWPQCVGASRAKLCPWKCSHTPNGSCSQEKPPGSWLQGTKAPFPSIPSPRDH